MHFCAARGIPHHITTWAGEKPRSGVSEAARLARYGLLAEAAEAEGGTYIVSPATRPTTKPKRSRCAKRAAMAGASQAWRPQRCSTGASGSSGRCWRRGRASSCGAFCARNAASPGSTTPPISNRPTSGPGYGRRCTDAGEGDRAGCVAGQTCRRGGRERERIAEAAARLVSRHAERPVRGLVRLRAAFSAKQRWRPCRPSARCWRSAEARRSFPMREGR
jgi:tRNA(Ile)-lysidine synthase